MKREDLFQVLSDMALAIQGAAAYPENHPKVQQLLVRLHYGILAEARRLEGLNIGFFGDHVVVDECPFVEMNSTLARLMARMRDKGIEKICFSEGITFGELKRFVYFLGEGKRLLADQKWESIVCGKVEGIESATAPLELTSAPHSNILKGAVEVLREVLASLSGEGKRTRVDEGREIVSSVIRGLREEGGIIERLMELQAHDDYTVTHSLNVCILVVAQAARLGLPESQIREVGLAALLHDIGKEIIPSQILNKPSRLEKGEFEKVREHPLTGAKLLRKIGCGTEIPMIVAFEHHVKYDRTGYPKLRSSEPLHIASYMTQIADVYDALRSFRPYMPSIELPKTLSIMKEGRGTEFEPRQLDNFLELISSPQEGTPEGSTVAM
jgi:putative nucleotidyltransferase with HDIG domain